MNQTPINVLQIAIQRMAIGTSVGIPESLLRDAEISVLQDHVLQKMVVALKTWVAARAHEVESATIRIPASWWDHLKQDAFPAWARKRCPPKYVERVVFRPQSIYVCPHHNIAWPKAEHIKWIARTEK